MSLLKAQLFHTKRLIAAINFAVDRTKTTGLEYFCLEHEVRRNVNDDVVAIVMILLELPWHPFWCLLTVRNWLKQ